MKKHITDEMKRNIELNQRIYKRPIIIEKKEEPIQLDDGTWRSDGWSVWKKVYANVAKFNSNEIFEAGQTRAEEKIRFFIRYMPSLSNEVKEDYRIRFNERLYNIENVLNLNYMNVELEITCSERSLTDASG